MKLKKIKVSILPILVFEDGEDRERVVWNHVCGGTSCLADEFDTKINYLLNAHGITDLQISITDHVEGKPIERGCNDCHYCEWAARQDMGGSLIVMRCKKDHTLDSIESDVSDLTGDLNLIQGRLFRDSKERATPCDHFKMTNTGLNKWVQDRR